MNERQLKARTKTFALRVLKLVEQMPTQAGGRTIANQLARCGTSVGANYRAACRTRSRAEFLGKLAVVEEEADESGYWLESIIESGLMPKERIEPLLPEAGELVAIVSASRLTLKRRHALTNDHHQSPVNTQA